MTPTSSKVAAIGACGLCTVTRTPRTCGKRCQHGVGDRAGGGFDQPIAARAERLARRLDDRVVGNRVLELVAARGGVEIDIEHEIEPEGLPDLGLVLHDAVIGVQRQSVDEDRVAHRARLIAAATASACTVGATSWTRMMAAPFSTAIRCAASEPPSRSLGVRRRDRVDEALARGADQERQTETAPVVEPRDAGQALLRRLAEADAGIEHDAVMSDAGRPGDFERAGEEIRRRRR